MPGEKEKNISYLILSTNLLDFKSVKESTILQILKHHGYHVNNLREAFELATIEIRKIYLNYF